MRSRLLSAFGRLAQIMSHMVCSDEQPCSKLASENKLQLFHFREGLYYIQDPQRVCVFQAELKKHGFKCIYLEETRSQSGSCTGKAKSSILGTDKASLTGTDRHKSQTFFTESDRHRGHASSTETDRHRGHASFRH